MGENAPSHTQVENQKVWGPITPEPPPRNLRYLRMNKASPYRYPSHCGQNCFTAAKLLEKWSVRIPKLESYPEHYCRLTYVRKLSNMQMEKQKCTPTSQEPGSLDHGHQGIKNDRHHKGPPYLMAGSLPSQPHQTGESD